MYVYIRVCRYCMIGPYIYNIYVYQGNIYACVSHSDEFILFRYIVSGRGEGEGAVPGKKCALPLKTNMVLKFRNMASQVKPLCSADTD